MKTNACLCLLAPTKKLNNWTVFSKTFKSKKNANIWVLILTNRWNLLSTVKKLAKKLAKFSGVAYSARIYFTKNQISTFYNADVKSTIEYGLLIYGNTYRTHIDEIHKMEQEYVGPFSLNEKRVRLRISWQNIIFLPFMKFLLKIFSNLCSANSEDLCQLI